MSAAARPAPSPWGAAFASAAFPGWGQLRVGCRRTGLGLITSTALLLAASMAAISVDGLISVLQWLFDPELIVVLLFLDLVIGVIRLSSTTHAWLAAGGRLASLGLLTVIVFVAVPHVALGYYGMETRSTVLAVFIPSEPEPSAGPESEGAPDSSLTTHHPELTTINSPPTTRDPGPTTQNPQPTIRNPILPVPELALPSTTTPPSTTTTTLPLGTERLNVLLLGADSGPGRRGIRTDTVMVASINTLTGDAALFGLPRNVGGLSFSDGSPFPGLGRGMLNEVYQWGWRNPDRFGGTDPGAAAVADVASTLLGIAIHHFVIVDMVGFAELVDALGGVTVPVSREIRAPLYDRATGGHTMITIPSGDQRMDGDLALAYSRSRTGSNDYSRMARQRCVLSSLAIQLEPLRLFARFSEILATIENRVTTDIPLSKIPFIVNLLPKVDPQRVIVVGFERSHQAGRTENGLPRPDVARIQAEVQQALAGEVHDDSTLAFAAGACAT